MRLESLHQEVISLAKYKPGEKVVFKTYNRKEVSGIIRSVHAHQRYSNELCLCYEVGKITKSGKMHKSQNAYYAKINEDKLMLSE